MWDSLKMPMDLAAGETRYIRLSIAGDMSVGYNTINTHVQWILSEVPAVTARGEIAEQKFEAQNKAMPAEFKP